MPLAEDEIRVDHGCGRDATGRPVARVRISVAAGALRRLGLHPDQPAARVTGPSPPGWWHAAAEQRFPGRTTE